MEVGSSRVMRLRSTHWRAAMEVISLVQEAMMNVASSVMDSVGDLGPNAWA